MLHSALGAFPFLLLRVSCWPFWTLPFPAICMLLSQAVPSLCPSPWVTSHSCSHSVIPTALPQQTHCCGGGSRFSWEETSTGQDWPLQASVSHPLAVVADWPVENHGWLHKAYQLVSTQHSVRTSVSTDSIICRNICLVQVLRSPGTLLQGKQDGGCPGEDA